MTNVIDLVDSIEYTTTNCFTHQLHSALHEVEPSIKTIGLADIERHPSPDWVVCRLKQRTVFREIDRLQRWTRGAPMVVYDQDPWEAFRDGSPFKGTYELASKRLNVVTFAVTTSWWAEYLRSVGHPSTFVRMWVMPQYCRSTPSFSDRLVPVGFVGALHPYRQAMFERLASLGTNVDVRSARLDYDGYLCALSTIGCYVHSEDAPMMVDNMPSNLNVGLWIKDIEAASRGCYSIRNRGSDADTYLDGIETVMLYDDVDEVPGIIDRIQKLDAVERQSTIDRTVKVIQGSNRWLETAATLVMNMPSST